VTEELLVISKAEVCNGLGSLASSEQFQDFSARHAEGGASKGKSVRFHVIVPKTWKVKLVSVLNEYCLLQKPNTTRWTYG
jgi:hypothetical protein